LKSAKDFRRAGEEEIMPPKKKTVEPLKHPQVAIALESGEVELAQDDFTMQLSGSNMNLTKRSPFSLDRPMSSTASHIGAQK